VIRVTEDQYDEWFVACGYFKTGEGTELTEDLMNDRGTVITVPRASVLSAEDRVEATQGMSKYFRWSSKWGAH